MFCKILSYSQITLSLSLDWIEFSKPLVLTHLSASSSPRSWTSILIHRLGDNIERKSCCHEVISQDGKATEMSYSRKNEIIGKRSRIEPNRKSFAEGRGSARAGMRVIKMLNVYVSCSLSAHFFGLPKPQSSFRFVENFAQQLPSNVFRR